MTKFTFFRSLNSNSSHVKSRSLSVDLIFGINLVNSRQSARVNSINRQFIIRGPLDLCNISLIGRERKGYRRRVPDRFIYLLPIYLQILQNLEEGHLEKYWQVV